MRESSSHDALRVAYLVYVFVARKGKGVGIINKVPRFSPPTTGHSGSTNKSQAAEYVYKVLTWS